MAGKWNTSCPTRIRIPQTERPAGPPKGAVSLGRRRFLAILFLSLWLLGGCGGRSHREKAAFLQLRTKWLEQGSFSLRGKLRADYGDRVYDFVLGYEGDGDGGTLTVEEPLELSGVAAELGEEGVTLRYDGFLLDTGAVLGDLSPLEAFPLMIRCWQHGFVTDCWRENWEGEACLTAQFDLTKAGETEERLCISRFRPDGTPLETELLADGYSVLRCRFLE